MRPRTGHGAGAPPRAGGGPGATKERRRGRDADGDPRAGRGAGLPRGQRGPPLRAGGGARRRPGEPLRTGDVQHDAETGWSLRFDPAGGQEELTEPVIGAGSLRPGEYVTIRAADDGRDYGYRVVSLS